MQRRLFKSLARKAVASTAVVPVRQLQTYNTLYDRDHQLIYLKHFGTFKIPSVDVRTLSSSTFLQRKRKSTPPGSKKGPKITKLGSGSGSSEPGDCPKCGSPLTFFWRSPNEGSVNFHICTNKSCQIVVLTGIPNKSHLGVVEQDVDLSDPNFGRVKTTNTSKAPKRPSYDAGLSHHPDGSATDPTTGKSITAGDALQNELDEELVSLEDEVVIENPTPIEIFEFLDKHVIGQQQAKRVLAVAVYNHYKRVQYYDKLALDKLKAEAKARADNSASNGSANFDYQEYLPNNSKLPSTVGNASTIKSKSSMLASSSTFKSEDSQSTIQKLEKSNILLLGPTGSGKTLVTKNLAEATGVPFSMSDATTLTQAGYVGEDVESVISKLLMAADGDVENAEHGIVFIDEIDKIAARAGKNQRDVGGEGVQQSLLKMLEGTSVSVSHKNPLTGKKENVDINTGNILFVCSGAFSGIEGIINQRADKKSIGFGSKRKTSNRDAGNTSTTSLSSTSSNPLTISQTEGKDDKNTPWAVIPQDLVKFGMIPEFIGRLPVIVCLHQLSTEHLVRILTEPKNAIVPQYEYLFELDNVKLEITEDALFAIAEEAIDNGTGARGLRAIIEKLLLEPMYLIPKSEITHVTVTAAVVRGEIPPIYESRKEEDNTENTKSEELIENEPKPQPKDL